MRNRLLFLYRRRESYGTESFTSGLRNSIMFVSDMVEGLGIAAKAVEVVDANSIDKEVTTFSPTHVFLEAFWVPPGKLDELFPLHPHVRWIVRSHSETPFLANEGIAMEWMVGYLRRGVEVQCNSQRSYHDLRMAAHAIGAPEHLVTFLPNYYPRPGVRTTRLHPDRPSLHIGCFGAVRPLKNHLIQAIAAMAFADQLRWRLQFHINAARVEANGDPVLKNLRALFAASCRHQLIEHPWAPRDEFLTLMRQMDLSMQVSLSETFNIVTADAVDCDIPAVVSPEVSWLGDYAMASPHEAKSIVNALWVAWETPRPVRLAAQRRDLSAFATASENAWDDRFGS